MTQEALKLALEALENSQNFVEASANAKLKDGWGEQLDEADKAIAAIKEALAQPEQEPVAKNEEGRITWLVDDWPQNCFLYAEPPKWTPVEIGVDVTNEGAHVVGMYVLPDAVRYVFYSEFHFAPQRKPLTDEEFDKLLGPFPRYAEEWSMTDFIRFARAIEAAHGIKENT